jgi:hypothetical protein
VNVLQKWLDRLLGREQKSALSVPDQRPNAGTTSEEDAAELRRDALQKEEKRRDELGSGPPDYDV